jgi:hypothetical protein
MTTRSGGRAAARRRRGFIAALVAIAALTSFVFASTAAAEPKGVFSVFSDCPTATPGAELCIYGATTSGEFTLGKTKVPINKTITIQGGAIPTGNPENGKEYFVIPAKDGNSLSKTALNVPGGLLGVNCYEIKGEGWLENDVRALCKEIFENSVTGVTATTELAATPTNPPILDLVALSQEEGTALTLPVRVHLKNPLLGNTCYIGSTTHPIQLHLTTGATAPPLPNKSIHGARGEAETLERNEQFMLRLFGNSLVDNAWAAPVAEGCGEAFAFLIDPLIDAKIGLPSAAGHNSAILSGELKTATIEAVLANET